MSLGNVFKQDVVPISDDSPNSSISPPGATSCHKTPIVEIWMQKIEITKYPNGNCYSKVSMWQQGTKNLERKRKPKVQKSMTVNKEVKKRNLFEVKK